MTKLAPADILRVAKQIKVVGLSKEEIEEIIENHADAQKDDPSATWDLVVEEQIQEILRNRE